MEKGASVNDIKKLLSAGPPVNGVEQTVWEKERANGYDDSLIKIRQ